MAKTAKKSQRRSSDISFLDTANKLLKVYPKIAEGLPKTLERKKLEDQIGSFAQALSKVQDADALRKAAVVQKRNERKQLNTFVKRVRRGVESYFGDDSAEYSLVGGKRLSQRKRPVRKPKTKPAA